jgi:hypothetical protein
MGKGNPEAIKNFPAEKPGSSGSGGTENPLENRFLSV